MDKLTENSEIVPESTSEQSGELRKLPPTSFRGIECSLLAEQYRLARALYITERSLLNEGGHTPA